jgi:hypothetical protein
MKKVKIFLMICVSFLMASCVDNIENFSEEVNVNDLYGCWKSQKLANNKYLLYMERDNTYRFEVYEKDVIDEDKWVLSAAQSDSGDWNLQGNRLTFESKKTNPETVMIRLTSHRLTIETNEGTIFYTK